MKFEQLHYFLSQNRGGGQKILCPVLYRFIFFCKKC